jgi:protein-tyrosine phosphatase
MDINLFKPKYHDLFKILTDANKLIKKSFKRGAPEGPPVLRDVYELQMELRNTTLNNPTPVKIKEVLEYVLDYFKNHKANQDITNLQTVIHQYLTKV